MCEIKNILCEFGYSFQDKRLEWGAKASQYKDELAKVGNKRPVLIELEVDIAIPDSSIIIDHHNERAGRDKPTSIEQVASFLGIKLNRWQRLIAANDKGWIPAMEKFGATQIEIQKVRRYDRQCQRITEETEQQAEQICSGIEPTAGPVVLYVGFDQTSPIIDRLYGKAENILIFGPKSTTFSGDGRIVRQLAKLYPQSFFGGELPERGFWGMSQKEEKIKELILKLWEDLND